MANANTFFPGAGAAGGSSLIGGGGGLLRQTKYSTFRSGLDTDTYYGEFAAENTGSNFTAGLTTNVIQIAAANQRSIAENALAGYTLRSNGTNSIIRITGNAAFTPTTDGSNANLTINFAQLTDNFPGGSYTVTSLDIDFTVDFIGSNGGDAYLFPDAAISPEFAALIIGRTVNLDSMSYTLDAFDPSQGTNGGFELDRPRPNPGNAGGALVGPGPQSATFSGSDLTVNPATDLGLVEGSLLGYFLVGGGGSALNNNRNGARGGRILQGTMALTADNFDQDWTFTIGEGLVYTASAATANTGGDSIIQLGTETLLTTANGNNSLGWGAILGDAGSSYIAGPGINGYGTGGGIGQISGGFDGNQGRGGGSLETFHGFGHGAPSVPNTGTGSDGAIILFYPNFTTT